MRNRISKNIIKVSSSGEILSRNIELPEKNTFAKAVKIPYDPANREKYKTFSKQVAIKVNAFKSLQNRNKELEALARKNSAKTIHNSFNKILANCKED